MPHQSQRSPLHHSHTSSILIGRDANLHMDTSLRHQHTDSLLPPPPPIPPVSLSITQYLFLI